MIDDFRRRLVNRLEVEAWYGDHPEITALPVRGPVDINGLPRTGTTALANMMSLDPQFRCLRQWEQAQPCPPPTLEDEATDPRRVRLVAANEQIPAELKAMHLYDVDATTEDTELLGMAFHGQQFTLPVYGYHAWWRDADLTSTYAYHRRVVQLLQSRRPPDRWLFKAPHHNFHLEAIVSAYPDARFIMTHRDPAKAVPSWASIVSTIFPAAQGERDLHRLGGEVSEHLRVGVEHAIAARARIGEARFLDVHHRDLIADHLGTVRGIYEFLGLELQPSVEQAISRGRRPTGPAHTGRTTTPRSSSGSAPRSCGPTTAPTSAISTSRSKTDRTRSRSTGSSRDAEGRRRGTVDRVRGRRRRTVLDRHPGRSLQQGLSGGPRACGRVGRRRQSRRHLGPAELWRVGGLLPRCLGVGDAGRHPRRSAPGARPRARGDRGWFGSARASRCSRPAVIRRWRAASHCGGSAGECSACSRWRRSTARPRCRRHGTVGWKR